MPRQGAIVAVLAIAGLASSFMFTLVVPIQSKLPELLDASREDTAWVVTSTLLAAAIITPISGRLGDMYGKRRIVLVLLALLVLGSVIAALSPGIVGIIIAGQLFDRFRSAMFPLLSGMFLAGAIATAMIGYSAPNFIQVCIFSAIAGFFIPAGVRPARSQR